jgi:GT2 family glycosyltransferase
VGDVGLVAVGKNEGERLDRCLRSVTGRGMTVVYVDSASTDGSPDRARAAGAEVVALDMSLAFSAARARREGFERLLKVDPGVRFVQFIDGDCEVVDGWIARARDELVSRHEVAVVCGRRTERHPEHSVYNRLADMAWNGPPGETSACGGDSLMRVEALLAADGGWNPRAMIGEEAELCIRLRALGWKVVRLDAPMTVHDMAMTRFSQWWKRTARTGYGFAEGVARHGSGPERHMVREHRSVLFWGLALPLVALALTWPTRGSSVLMLAAYPLLYARIVRRLRRDGWTPEDAKLYAWSCVVGKFAQALGVCRFWWRWYLGKEGVWIEYKDSGRPAEKAGATAQCS